MLAGLIENAEAKCEELTQQCEEAETIVASAQTMLKALTSQYEELISRADLYDRATFEAKKDDCELHDPAGRGFPGLQIKCGIQF